MILTSRQGIGEKFTESSSFGPRCLVQKNKPALSVPGKTFDASYRQHESRAAFFRRYDLDHFKLTIPFLLEGLLLRFYNLVGSGILKTGE
jgi:hypothetical protein